jgi:cobalt/nickel transport system permease protein
MHIPLITPLWAVHISDGVLTWPWLLGGFLVAGILAWKGAWKIRDDEIPQVAVMTATFFVASLIHVRLLHTSVHLLLNGLVGVVIGRRAALAIPVGLFLQAVLVGHGGITALGVNSCVMVLPALMSWKLFSNLQRSARVSGRWFRDLLIIVGTLLWMFALVYVGALLIGQGWLPGYPAASVPSVWALRVALHPVTVVVTLIVSAAAIVLERRLTTTPEFALGFLVGVSAVLGTVLLNCVVLAFGAEEDWHSLAELVFIAHLPIALIEGLITGSTVGFLARVKPELLTPDCREDATCASDC